MSLLSYYELISLVNAGVITAPIEQINATSIDLTLGDTIFIEAEQNILVQLEKKKQKPIMAELVMPKGGLVLAPGAFVLGCTRETFNLPDDISAEYKLNSSLARAGLDHLNAGWCNPGWHGSVLTLEFKNCLQFQSLYLTAGMKCGQMVFFKHRPVPEHISYRTIGIYNKDKKPQESKGLKIRNYAEPSIN